MSKNLPSNEELKEIEKEFELKVLRERIAEVEKENSVYRKYLEANDLLVDIEDLTISDEEYVCINEIKKLKVLSDGPGLTLDDIKALDILHKNLRMIKGITIDNFKGKGKKAVDPKELFKIVENSK